ncbi:hypothetical protein QW71_35755 [Paenibacillus sp. IHB B 3415]|nr:hypothetical protein QW71_35755 [Paenibacillus sp. IHB B 3415]
MSITRNFNIKGTSFIRMTDCIYKEILDNLLNPIWISDYRKPIDRSYDNFQMLISQRIDQLICYLFSEFAKHKRLEMKSYGAGIQSGQVQHIFN